MKAINNFVVQTAVDLGLEDASRLRVDCTVVQTDIHHPTDNTLLWDVVQRRRMQQIQRMTPKQRQHQLTKKYRELIAITQEVIQAARAVLTHTHQARSCDPLTDVAIGQLRREIEDFCQLGDRVVDQTRRRVLGVGFEGRASPGQRKSLFHLYGNHQAQRGSRTRQRCSPAVCSAFSKTKAAQKMRQATYRFPALAVLRSTT